MSEILKLTARDGHKFDAYLAQPAGKPRAGVIVIQEIFGVNSHIRGVTDSYAREGYLAIAPALFDRIRPNIELGYEAEDVTAGLELKGQVAPEQAVLDLQAAVTAVNAAGKVGVVGYCWGGLMTWLAATRVTGIAAASSYYGGGTVNYIDETPHCPVMFHFGDQDHAIPMEQVETIQQRQPDSALHVYPAGHGFNCDQRGSYEEVSARIARDRTLDFFAKNLV